LLDLKTFQMPYGYFRLPLIQSRRPLENVSAAGTNPLFFICSFPAYSEYARHRKEACHTPPPYMAETTIFGGADPIY
jgi:hypothetical protein